MDDWKHKYKALKPLGEGSFSTVYKCTNAAGQIVALKELKSEWVTSARHAGRFLREINILRKLTKVPNVVRVLDADTGPQPLWYVMPMASSNLREYFRYNNDKLDFADRFKIFKDVAGVMIVAHAMGLAHRDLCPENVLCYNVPEIEICVSNFGLGLDASTVQRFTRSSVAGYGHLNYIAPEQNESLKSSDDRSDIYSLGKLLNFILTGREPSHYQDCKLPVVVKRSTSIDSAARYSSVSEMLEEAEKHAAFELGTLLPTQPKNMDQLVEAISNQEMQLVGQWHEIIRLVRSPEVLNHVFYDTLAPLAKILKQRGAVESMDSELGASVDDFAKLIVDRLDECCSSVNWPFKRLDELGEMLGEIALRSECVEAQLVALKHLWGMAWIQDQWAMQSLVNKIITRKRISPMLVNEFAQYVLTDRSLPDESKLSLAQIPQPLRDAIRNRARSSIQPSPSE